MVVVALRTVKADVEHAEVAMPHLILWATVATDFADVTLVVSIWIVLGKS